MDSALEDAEAEAQTDAENSQVTALKYMVLNDEASVDLELRVQAAQQESDARARELGIAPSPATRVASLWEARHGHDCIIAWKAALHALKASIPDVCLLAVKAPKS